MSAVASRSRPIVPRSPSTTSIGTFLRPTCWQRGQTFGCRRFQKETGSVSGRRSARPEQRACVSVLGQASEFTCVLAATDRSLTRQVRELLLLVREYGQIARGEHRVNPGSWPLGASAPTYIFQPFRSKRMRRGRDNTP